MKMALSSFGALTLLSCGGGSEDNASSQYESESAAQSGNCAPRIFEDDEFAHCVARPELHAIEMRLAGRDGTPLRSLAALAREAGSGDVDFAMNAGMFDEEGQPVGFYVEERERLREISEADGPGNFHMKPNGVFYGSNGEWKVKETVEFVRTVRAPPDFATQSGPMLVIDGSLHPDLAVDGASRYVRNAVGVDAVGRAHFVISKAPVSFGKLARFMRDELGTANALYLDGAVSALWDPGAGRLDESRELGPLVVVRRRDEEQAGKGVAP